MIRGALSGSVGSRWKVLVDVAGFQIVWLACAFGVASGTSAPGLAAAAAFIALQVATSECAGATFRMLAVAGLSGLLAESMLAALDLIRYAAPWPGERVAPAWIVALWMCFGTTAGTLARLLGGRLLLAAIAGSLLGPVSYVAGAAIGALTLAEPLPVSLLAVAALWALILPLLISVWTRSKGCNSTSAE